MRGAILFLFIFGMFHLVTYPQSLKEILKNPQYFDNRKIVFEGEVIGEPLKEEGGVWINIKQGRVGIGVFLENPEEVTKIKNFGSYKRRGDWVQIEGVFFNNCPVHLERDIHAYKLKVIKPGFILREEIPLFKRKLSLGLALLCLTLGIICFITLKYVRRD